RRATSIMVRHELSRGFPRAARLLLAELEDPPAELTAAVEAAERREAETASHVARLEAQVKERSSDAANRDRSLYSFFSGLGVIVASVAAQAVQVSGVLRFTTATGLPFAGLMIANSGFYMLWVYRSRDANTLQRQIALGLLGLNVFSLGVWVLAWRAQIELAPAMALYFLMNAAAWWIGALMLEVRGIWLVASFTAAAALSMAFPAWAPLTGACVGAGFLLLARDLAKAP